MREHIQINKLTKLQEALKSLGLQTPCLLMMPIPDIEAMNSKEAHIWIKTHWFEYMAMQHGEDSPDVLLI